MVAIVRRFEYLMNTNSEIDKDGLKWSKVPKWYILSTALCCIPIVFGILTLIGIVHSRTPLITGWLKIGMGAAFFTSITTMAALRFKRLRKIDRALRTTESAIYPQKFLPPFKSTELQPKNENQQNTFIGRLPINAIFLIVNNLDESSLYKISRVCRFLFNISYECICSRIEKLQEASKEEIREYYGETPKEQYVSFKAMNNYKEVLTSAVIAVAKDNL